MPENATLTEVLERAIEHHRNGELTPAEAGYRQILQEEPEHADALHLSGILFHQLGASTDAIQAIRHSLAVNPSQPRACNNLGNVYAAMGRWQEAVQSYEQAIALRPEDASSHVSLASLLETLDRLESAVVEYRAGLEWDPRSASAQGGLGSVLRKLGRLDEARAVYDDWLTLDRDNPIALHLRAACTREGGPVRASDAYVRAAFDGIAHEFDECLGKLDYRVPGLIAEAMERHVGQAARGELDILDLGCGTGLCALPLKARARRLVGADLSPNMLAQAREKNLYDELVETELTAFLQSSTADYDAIVSGDTLIYTGDLGPVFAAAAKALRVGGILLFTLEAQDEDGPGGGYRFNASGRYAHSPRYVRRALTEAGFEVIGLEEAVMRQEGGRSVPGVVVAARRLDA